MQSVRPRFQASARARIRSRALASTLLAFLWQAGAHAEDRSGDDARRAPEWIPKSETHPAAMVFAPKDDGAPHAVTVMLHGRCGVPENECPSFADAVTKDSWLVCPRGPVDCDNGGATWSSEGRSELVDAAVRAVMERHPNAVDLDRPRTLIGFSLGAFVALDIAHHDVGRWPRLLLIAAKILPEPSLLRKNGVERVLFASGAFDLSHDHMVNAARRLGASGTFASFLSLGPVGHRFARDMGDWTARAFDWLRNREAPSLGASQP